MHIFLTVAAMVSINVHEMDTDGTHNYLLQFQHNHVPYYVSYSTKYPLVIKDRAFAIMDLECEAGKGIDEKMSDQTNQWISYTINTCDMVKLIKWTP